MSEYDIQYIQEMEKKYQKEEAQDEILNKMKLINQEPQSISTE